jgi:hypothetical protein
VLRLRIIVESSTHRVRHSNPDSEQASLPANRPCAGIAMRLVRSISRSSRFTTLFFKTSICPSHFLPCLDTENQKDEMNIVQQERNLAKSAQLSTVMTSQLLRTNGYSLWFLPMANARNMQRLVTSLSTV